MPHPAFGLVLQVRRLTACSVAVLLPSSAPRKDGSISVDVVGAFTLRVLDLWTEGVMDPRLMTRNMLQGISLHIIGYYNVEQRTQQLDRNARRTSYTHIFMPVAVKKDRKYLIRRYEGSTAKVRIE